MSKQEAKVVGVRIAGFIGLLSVVAAAHSDSISWTPVTEDVDGQAIAATDIEYQVYWSLDDAVWTPTSGGTTPLVSLPLDTVPPGCFYFRVTAIRTDAELDIEGAPSSAVYYCGASEGLAAPLSPVGVILGE